MKYYQVKIIRRNEMTEKEFRKLVTDMEISKEKRDSLLALMDELAKIISKGAGEHFVINEVNRSGAWAKGTMLKISTDLDFVVTVEPRLIKSYYLVNKVIINDIVNALIVNLEAITKLSDLNCDERRNMLTFTMDGYNISLTICYPENCALADFNNNASIILDNKRIQFVELANRDYSYFRNAVQVIKYYRDEQRLTNISGYLLEIILYYSLNEYFIDNRYKGYLNAFLRGLDDFISGKKIEVSKDIYQKLEIVNNGNEIKKPYTVIDVVNPNNNLAEDVNEIKIGDYRKLKKALAKLVETNIKDMQSGLVKLNVNPVLNSDNSTYSWSFKIEDTSVAGSGGSYSNSDEDIYTAIYKALLKGLKAIVDNNFNRKQVMIICNKPDILTNDKGLSSENNSRRKNVVTFIDNNQFKVVK